MRELPTGTVTLLFTDIEGSTRLLSELGERYADVLADHRLLLRDAFARHGGVEVDTQGDAFFVAFARASDAVAAASDAQAALRDAPVRVRIGIHTGEPIVTDEGYVGIDVHRAARVMSAGHGGQILVSQTTRDLLAGNELSDLGAHRLKDLSEAQHLYQLGSAVFPPLKTLDATNLPIAASPLLGREREVAELVSLLSDGSRLVTVTGPGGTGKTRLALQVAAELVGSVRDGVFWVPLAGLSDSDLVLTSIAQALGAREELRAHLRGRELLLQLDNAEHLLGAAPALAELLATSPGLRLLVTSRAPLHIAGEREYPLDPLPLDDAAMLFCERARSVGRELGPDETVVAICRRLDGLPLAIELAAARTRLLDLPTLLARLDRALSLLTGGARDAPKRQHTLRATIDWSYELLDEESKHLFARLSVFSGSFALQAAEEVCDADLDTLSELVDASLVKAAGDSRLLLLELMKEYARDRIDQVGGGADLRDRHAAYYARLADCRWAGLVGGEDVEWVHAVEHDRRNLDAALEWSIERGRGEDALAIASGAWPSWMDLRVARRRLERVLALPAEPVTARRAHTLAALGNTAQFQSDLPVARRAFEEALLLHRTLDEPFGIAVGLAQLADIALDEGDRETARRFAEESVAIRRQRLGSRRLGRGLASLAEIALTEGDLDRARRLVEEAVERTRVEAPDGVHLPEFLEQLGEIMRRQGDHAGSLRAFAESLRLGGPLRDALAIAGSLDGIAVVSSALGDRERAARLAGAAERVRADSGLVQTRPDRPVPDPVEPAWSEGYAMTAEEAVEYALRDLD